MPLGDWLGHLELGDGWAVWSGSVGDGAAHRHFAAQAVLAPTPVCVEDAAGQVTAARCVLIEPLVPHRLRPAPEARLVYVEPSRRLDPALGRLLDPVRSMDGVAVLEGTGARPFWRTWRGAGPKAAPVADPRVRRAMDLVERMLADGPVALPAAARAAGLSPERLRHLFVDKTGLPFRRYVLWRRLRLAAGALLAGADVTSAAHAAGFADAAHFARTLKSTFGVTATQARIGR